MSVASAVFETPTLTACALSLACLLVARVDSTF